MLRDYISRDKRNNKSRLFDEQKKSPIFKDYQIFNVIKVLGYLYIGVH